MTNLTFETLSFEKGEKEVLVNLLRQFSVKIPLEEFNRIGKWKIINEKTISFEKIDEEKARTKISYLLEKYYDHLVNKLNGNKTIYVHKNSGIPLIGNVAFGIAYRNSSIIEIKPITSCNLNCVYCSLSEGLNSKKTDFLVQEEYLIEELQKLLEFAAEPVEIHIGVQGEPFLYADMELLIKDLQRMEKVQAISIDTNGTLLTTEIIDRLAKNDKLQLNFSFDAIDEKVAKKMAGVDYYNQKHVQEMISYASQKMNVIVAPVLVSGYNEGEMEKIILWIKSISRQPRLGIQNFLRYKTGKNPAREMKWSEFYDLLKKLEQKHDLKLKLSKEDFNVKKTKELIPPFKEGDIINAVIKCPDRFENTVIAAAKERNISIANYKFNKGKKIKIKIIKNKHNIFRGEIIK